MTLQPGAYSAILSGVNRTTGFGVVEVYEFDDNYNSSLINISTRGYVNRGDERMIGGFVIQGDQPMRVYIRVSGPGLSSIIENRLMDPMLELFSGQDVIVSNDNWQDSDSIDAIVATGIAPSNNNEPAIVATLEPGAYTAVVGGANSSIGYANLEIYYYAE